MAAIAEEKAARPDLLALCQGGPITEPTEARYLVDRVPGLDGFQDASSMERLSTEVAFTRQDCDFVGPKRTGKVGGGPPRPARGASATSGDRATMRAAGGHTVVVTEIF